MVDFSSLSLDLLKTLMVFSETGRVEETARRLGMTQAGVSIQLKKLEEQVGVPLFRMVGRQKALTEFARDLAQSIAPPLRDLEHRLSEVSRLSLDPALRTLRVGCRSEIMSRALRYLQFPGRMTLHAGSRSESIERLKMGKIDVAILQDPPVVNDFFARPLFLETADFVCSPSLLKVKTWRELWEHREELRLLPGAAYKKENPPFLAELARGLELEGNEFQVKYVCEEWNAIKNLVKDGRAWSVIPEGFLEGEEELHRIPLPKEFLSAAQFYVVATAEWKDSLGRMIVKN